MKVRKKYKKREGDINNEEIKEGKYNKERNKERDIKKKWKVEITKRKIKKKQQMKKE